MARWVIGLCLIPIFTLLTGCPSDAEVQPLTLWAMGREGEAVQALTAEFERRHPGVRVRVQQIPWSAAHEKLLTAFAGDALPDIIQLGNTWVPEFAALEAIMPLELDDASAADVFPGILASSSIDGRLLAMPWYVDTRLLFYRKDVLAQAGFERPPATWAEWRQAMARIVALPGPSRFAMLLPLNEWQPLAVLALQAGATLLRDDDRQADFQSPAFRQAFGFYLDLFRQGYAPALAEAQLSNVYQDFAEGRFAFYISGPWNLGEFRQRLPARVQALWDTAPMPGPDGPGVSLAGGSSLAVCRSSRQPEAARELVAYLTDPEQQVAFYRLTGDLPARRSAWSHPDLAQAPHTEAFRRQLDQVRPTPKIPEWERIADKLGHTAEKAVRGELSQDEALAALNVEVDRILAKRRWLLDQAASRRGRP
jgi:multiple sugar transport system substrate-binding protein